MLDEALQRLEEIQARQNDVNESVVAKIAALQLQMNNFQEAFAAKKERDEAFQRQVIEYMRPKAQVNWSDFVGIN